jgi:hypothetical protein
MFAALHSDISSIKSALFHLTVRTNSQKGRAKVRDGIITVFKFLVII